MLDWFDDAGNAAATAVLVSLGSLLVSGLSIWLAVRSSRKSNELQRRIVEIEERREADRTVAKRRAELIARVVREPGRGTSKNYYLEIENVGKADARSITIRLDDGPAMEHPAFLKGAELREQVGPGGAFRFMLVPSFSTPFPTKVCIDWGDDSNEPGHFETGLTL